MAAEYCGKVKMVIYKTRRKHRQPDFLLKGMESLQLQLKIHSVIADGI